MVIGQDTKEDSLPSKSGKRKLHKYGSLSALTAASDSTSTKHSNNNKKDKSHGSKRTKMMNSSDVSNVRSSLLDGKKQFGFSFSPCGLLASYHFGVADALRHYGLIDDSTHLGGASAGAITAACVALDMSTNLCLETVYDIQKNVNSSGAARGKLSQLVKSVLRKYLAENSALAINQRKAPTTIGFTAMKPLPSGIYVQEFYSREDLISCINASCNIPFYYSQWPTVRCRGQNCVDGFFAPPRGYFGCPPLSSDCKQVCVTPFYPMQVGLTAVDADRVISPELAFNDECITQEDRKEFLRFIKKHPAPDPPVDLLLETFAVSNSLARPQSSGALLELPDVDPRGSAHTPRRSKSNDRHTAPKEGSSSAFASSPSTIIKSAWDLLSNPFSQSASSASELADSDVVSDGDHVQLPKTKESKLAKMQSKIDFMTQQLASGAFDKLSSWGYPLLNPTAGVKNVKPIPTDRGDSGSVKIDDEWLVSKAEESERLANSKGALLYTRLSSKANLNVSEMGSNAPHVTGSASTTVDALKAEAAMLIEEGREEVAASTEMAEQMISPAPSVGALDQIANEVAKLPKLDHKPLESLGYALVGNPKLELHREWFTCGRADGFRWIKLQQRLKNLDVTDPSIWNGLIQEDQTRTPKNANELDFMQEDTSSGEATPAAQRRSVLE